MIIGKIPSVQGESEEITPPRKDNRSNSQEKFVLAASWLNIVIILSID